MSIQEVTTNELKRSIDDLKEVTVFIQDYLIKHVLTKDEAFGTFLTKNEALAIFATKDDMIGFKNEILTAVDFIAVRHNTFDQELLMFRSQYLRHEDRLELIENKLDI